MSIVHVLHERVDSLAQRTASLDERVTRIERYWWMLSGAVALAAFLGSVFGGAVLRKLGG